MNAQIPPTNFDDEDEIVDQEIFNPAEDMIDTAISETEDMIARQKPTSTRMSIADLLNANLPDPNYVVPGLIPVGLTYNTGRPKVGKSIFSLQLAKAKGTGGIS